MKGQYVSKIGFTGTQEGMTYYQVASVEHIVGRFKHKLGPNEVHHGDCIGSDENMHLLARGAYYRVIGHPPTDDKKRAFCEFDEIRPPKPYLERNKDVVDETDMLVATPDGFKERTRSGTWSTIRYARKKGKYILIVWPDGRVQEENRF